jgi:hypothetical protein
LDTAQVLFVSPGSQIGKTGFVTVEVVVEEAPVRRFLSKGDDGFILFFKPSIYS